MKLTTVEKRECFMQQSKNLKCFFKSWMTFTFKFYSELLLLKFCLVGCIFSGVSLGFTLEEAKVKALQVFKDQIAPIAIANGVNPDRCSLKSDVVETVQEFFFVVDCGRMAGAIVLDKNLEVVVAELY